MAGPAFQLLIRHPLTGQQIQQLDSWLKTFTTSMQMTTDTEGQIREWFFLVDDPTPLGLEHRSRSCYIGIALVEPDREMEYDEQEQIMTHIGFWPRHGINIYAMCKSFATGRIMSLLILRLMERFDAWLDLLLVHEVPKRVLFSTLTFTATPLQMLA